MIYESNLKLEPIPEEKRAAIFTAAFQSFLVSMSETHAIGEAEKTARKVGVHAFDATDIAADAVSVIRREIREKCAELQSLRPMYVSEYLSRFQNPLFHNRSGKGKAK